MILNYLLLQGATIKAEEGTGRILIARVMHGGAADRSGRIICFVLFCFVFLFIFVVVVVVDVIVSFLNSSFLFQFSV
jgi:hypothetical protein